MSGLFKYFLTIYFLTKVSFVFAYSTETKTVISPYTQESYEVSVLTRSDVDELFSRFVKNSLIPWEIVHDGCYERAYLMITQAKLKNVHMGKIVVQSLNPKVSVLEVKASELPNPVGVESTDPSLPWILRWQYHVAPYLFVKNESGQIKRFILDPSLFTIPVSEEIFVSKVSLDPNLDLDVFYLPSYVLTKDQINSKVNLERLDQAMLKGMDAARGFSREHGKYLEKTALLDSNQNLCYQGGLLVDRALCGPNPIQ